MALLFLNIKDSLLTAPMTEEKGKTSIRKVKIKRSGDLSPLPEGFSE